MGCAYLVMGSAVAGQLGAAGLGETMFVLGFLCNGGTPSCPLLLSAEEHAAEQK